MHKLINQLTLHDLKEHAKLLGKYLDNDLGIKINHSSVLNLAARGFGFKDYNTIKSYLDKMTECYVFSSTIKDIPVETILRSMQYVSQYVSLPELPIPVLIDKNGYSHKTAWHHSPNHILSISLILDSVHRDLKKALHYKGNKGGNSMYLI